MSPAEKGFAILLTLLFLSLTIVGVNGLLFSTEEVTSKVMRAERTADDCLVVCELETFSVDPALCGAFYPGDWYTFTVSRSPLQRYDKITHYK